MNELKWHNNYALGVEYIDREHKQLFLTMNKLLKIISDEEKTEWGCQEGAKYLKNHTIEHFEHEEEYMLSINYKDYELHKRLHDDFRYITLPALEMELEKTNYSKDSVRHFLGVCIGWVVAHTKTEDLAIVGKTASKWSGIPHKEDTMALEQAVIQLTYDMFQLNARKISEQYAGEDFGKTICNRLLYRNQNNEKREVILIFEESFLLKIIGRILNTDFPKIDDLVINITRYITRQLLEKLSEHIPSLGLYEVEKESLLTHEQLVNSFKREHPSCSLLFGTNDGYFVFCMANPASIQKKDLPSFAHANAIETIHRYIHENKTRIHPKNNENAAATKNTNKKRKILIVDDSCFMRNRMVNMLSSNYEISEADSSVSAIKKLTLDKPDLILLDYEMPICNGKQTLEMIRSEKDIADIPVIFLTSRRDKKTVQAVMELKPERYLIKTLPDEKIKENIDTFFKRQKYKSK